MNPETIRIHLITDSSSLIEFGRQYGPPLYLYDLKSYQPLIDTFVADYTPNHASVNDLWYESLCFYRWLVYSKIIKSWNLDHPFEPIRRILSLDTDIIILQDISRMIDRLLTGLSFWQLNDNKGILTCQLITNITL